MNFSEFFNTKINAMIYDRCMFNSQGKHRPEIAKYHLALLSNTSNERYDIYILRSDLLDYDAINVPSVNGEPAFALTEELYNNIDREFYFFEVHSGGVIFTPNFAFEKYEECGRYIMNYTKDTRMLDVMFKHITQEEAAAMGAQAASPIKKSETGDDEQETVSNGNATEDVKPSAPQSESVKADEEEVVVAAQNVNAEEPVIDIPMLAYDMFCLDITTKTKKELTEFAYTFESAKTVEKYDVSVIRSNHKDFIDVVVPEKDGKPLIVINKASYDKLTAEEFFFLEVASSGRTQVPNIKFETLEAAKKYMYNFTEDTRMLDVMFSRMTKEEASALGKQPSVKANSVSSDKAGSSVPPVNMSIYTRFCTRTTLENKDVYTVSKCIYNPENTDRKYFLRVLQSNSKTYDSIVIPVVNGKKLFELDQSDYEKLIAGEFFYIEATFNEKTGALNKIFKTADAAESYVDMYAGDIRELEVLFKNVTVDVAKSMGAVKGIIVDPDASEVYEESEEEKSADGAKVDFIDVGQNDSSKVQVAKEENDLFDDDSEQPQQKRRINLMTPTDDDSYQSQPSGESGTKTETTTTHNDKVYKNKITTDSGQIIYADKVVIQVAEDVQIKGAEHLCQGGSDFDELLGDLGKLDEDNDILHFNNNDYGLEDILAELNYDTYGNNNSILSSDENDLIYELLDGVDSDIYGDDMLNDIYYGL